MFFLKRSFLIFSKSVLMHQFCFSIIFPLNIDNLGSDQVHIFICAINDSIFAAFEENVQHYV